MQVKPIISNSFLSITCTVQINLFVMNLQRAKQQNRKFKHLYFEKDNFYRQSLQIILVHVPQTNFSQRMHEERVQFILHSLHFTRLFDLSCVGFNVLLVFVSGLRDSDINSFDKVIRNSLRLISESQVSLNSVCAFIAARSSKLQKI